MPPHCDALDGPVVTAARAALDSGQASDVLPFVSIEGEPEVQSMFDAVLPVHAAGGPAAALADALFFETVVRVHRAGEGAAYTGLKPAGLDVGPVIPLAEQAVQDLDASGLVAFLATTIERQLNERMARLRVLHTARDGSVATERAYVQAMLDFEVFSHRVYTTMLMQHAH